MRNDLEEGGRLLAQACAMSYGFAFTPQSLQGIHDMIRNGVREMMNKGEANNPQKILEAQNNLIRFVAQIVDEAQSMNLMELEEQTVLNAKMKFCPVYPFS